MAKDLPAGEEFFILSLRWTKENYATWWCPNNSGYTSVVADAGRYPRDAVAAARDYYDNERTTIAIPCAEVERVAQAVVFDHAFRRLVEPRVLRRRDMDDEGEECESCGARAPATSIGLKVAGVD